jgi:hypothetical protein
MQAIELAVDVRVDGGGSVALGDPCRLDDEGKPHAVAELGPQVLTPLPPE